MQQKKGLDETLARLDALAAYVKAVEGNPEAALRELAGRTDPEAIRRQLYIFREKKLFKEAASLVNDLTPHAYWCEWAIYACVRAGNFEKGKRFLEWADNSNDLQMRKRCRLNYASAAYDISFVPPDEEGAELLPGNLTAAQEAQLTEILVLLQPLLPSAEAAVRLSDQIETNAVRLAILCNKLLGNIEEAQRLARLLSQQEMPAIQEARDVLRRLIPAAEALPERLREEHPNQFEPRLWAALIQGEFLGEYASAYEEAKELVSLAVDVGEKRQICRLLFLLCQHLGTTVLDEAERLILSLLPNEDSFVVFMGAARCMSEGNADKALQLLETIQDKRDSYWLQGKANALIQKGLLKDASDHLVEACKLVATSPLLRKTAAVCYRCGRYRESLLALESLLVLEPNDPAARANAAALCIHMHDYSGAARHYKALRLLEPLQLLHSIQEAFCLAQAGNIDAGLSLLSSLPREEATFEVACAKAELFRRKGRVREAFTCLQQVRNQFWDQPAFLAEYMSVGYAAGEDHHAFEALSQLVKFQDEGRLEKPIFERKSVEDFISIAQEGRERQRERARYILGGRLPWLLVDNLRGEPTYSAWRSRTVSLSFHNEHPMARAFQTVYATNGFRLALDAGGDRSLERLECPRKGSRIVVDVSALITLHRLDLMSHAANYFDKVLIPSSYMALSFEERGRLIPHQLSRFQNSKTIEGAIAGHLITVMPPNTMPADIVRLDEYPDEDHERAHGYRLIDLTEFLHSEGRIDDNAYGSLKSVALRPSGVAAGVKSLAAGNPVQIPLSTMQTLCDFEILNTTCEVLRVFILERERDEVAADLKAFVTQEDVGLWHSDLWNCIHELPNIEVVPYARPEITAEHGDYRDALLASAMIAQERHLPLLADDRFLQTVLLNSETDYPAASFGTNELLLGLFESGSLDQSELTDKLLTLMKWRYRFLVPPAEVLVESAVRFKSNPPGRLLRDIALYEHDCLQDVGLFTGFEGTTVPTTMANSFYKAWLHLSARFLMKLWADLSLTNETCEAFTNWTVTYLLPGTAKTMGAPAHAVGSFCVKGFLDFALVECTGIRDVERGKRAMAAIRDALPMTESEYVENVAEALWHVR